MFQLLQVLYDEFMSQLELDGFIGSWNQMLMKNGDCF
jgi:hypothetical protein